MSGRNDDLGGFFYVLEDPIHILFADDDPILREFAVVHLSTAAARVETAEDGVAAWNTIQEKPCDLLLLDLEMPRMDGFEVLKKLRSTEELRRLPVIVVTGREDVFAIDRAFAEGADSFLVKPINWRLLSYQIRFVHRAAKAEAAVLKARAAARDEAAAAGQTLRTLAAQGARFMAQAMQTAPALRPAAEAYANALHEAAAMKAAPASAVQAA